MNEPGAPDGPDAEAAQPDPFIDEDEAPATLPDPIYLNAPEDESPETLPRNPEELFAEDYFNPKTHQSHQWWIVITLLIFTGLATVGVGLLAILAPDNAWSRITSQLAFLLTPFHTLLGIAVGYYFASQPRNGEANNKGTGNRRSM